MAEPVDPAVEQARIESKAAHRAVFAGLLAEGAEAGEWPPLDVDVAAGALVGALQEAVALNPAGGDALVASLVSFALQSVQAHAPDRSLRAMTTMPRTATADTHEVINQSEPFVDVNVFDSDAALQEAVEREGGGWGVDRMRDFGQVAGSAEADEHRRRAQRNVPQLHQHDRFGHRVDEVEYDPSMHWMLRLGVEREVNSLAWRDPRPGAHVVRYGLFYLMNQLDTGPCCPMSINYAATPTMRQDAALAAEWEPRLTLPDYDRFAQAGMVMTEKQGGSDLRANTTVAEPVGRRLVRAHRAQVVLHASGVRGVLHARAGPGRDHLLRRRAPAPGLSPPAPEGQARRPLPGFRRGRVRPPARPHPGRGGPRHGVHDRADHLDPDRHDVRRRGNDAAAAERGDLAHAAAAARSARRSRPSPRW